MTFRGSGGDAFVSKISADGSSLAYSTYLGGSSYDSGAGIAVDSSGSAYVTGFTDSADFPTTSGAFKPPGAGPFVTKLSADGTSLIYSTGLDGNDDASSAIAVDSPGNAYVTGAVCSPDLPTTATSSPGSISTYSPPQLGNS